MKDISFQLYSARHTPLADALKIVASSGYTGVEAYRENVADLDLFQSLLSDNNLQCTSIHTGLDELRANMSSCLLYTSPSPRDKRQSRMPSSA